MWCAGTWTAGDTQERLRAQVWAEFVQTRVLQPVPERHVVFAIPKMFRKLFRQKRALLPTPALCAWEALSEYMRDELPEPGY